MTEDKIFYNMQVERTEYNPVFSSRVLIAPLESFFSTVIGDLDQRSVSACGVTEPGGADGLISKKTEGGKDFDVAPN
jgi:hypothetical protein